MAARSHGHVLKVVKPLSTGISIQMHRPNVPEFATRQERDEVAGFERAPKPHVKIRCAHFETLYLRAAGSHSQTS
jgi:hypothetical protein